MVPSGIVFVRYLRLPLFILVQAIISQLNGCMFLCSLFLCLLGCCYTVENKFLKIPQTCTFFFFFIFLKALWSVRGNYTAEIKKAIHVLSRQYLPALNRKVCLQFWITNFIFGPPQFFQCLLKPLKSQIANQQCSCLGSVWQQLMLPWKPYILLGFSFFHECGQ